MSVGCEDEYNDFCVVDFIDKAMPFGDAATPLTSSFASQLFRLTCACARMFTQFRYQCLCLKKSFWLILFQSN